MDADYNWLESTFEVICVIVSGIALTYIVKSLFSDDDNPPDSPDMDWN